MIQRTCHYFTLIRKQHLVLNQSLSTFSIFIISAIIAIISLCRRAAILIGLIRLGKEIATCLCVTRWLRNITKEAKYKWHFIKILSLSMKDNTSHTKAHDKVWWRRKEIIQFHAFNIENFSSVFFSKIFNWCDVSFFQPSSRRHKCFNPPKCVTSFMDGPWTEMFALSFNKLALDKLNVCLMFAAHLRNLPLKSQNHNPNWKVETK